MTLAITPILQRTGPGGATSADEGSDLQFVVTSVPNGAGPTPAVQSLRITSISPNLDRIAVPDLVFSAVGQSQTVVLRSRQDSVVEANESFSVNFEPGTADTLISISNYSTGSLALPIQYNGSIIDNDAVPALGLSVRQAAIAENAPDGVFRFDITRAGADLSVITDVTLNFTGAGATPPGQADFAGSIAAQFIRFQPGETQKTVELAIRNDNDIEATESLSAFLSNALSQSPSGAFPGTRPSGIVGGQNSVTVSIIDDDPNSTSLTLPPGTVPLGGPPGTLPPIDVFRFFETRTGTHLYTTSTLERDVIQSTLPHYRYEGVAFDAVPEQPGSDPVYRFFETRTGTHFFTPSAIERDAVIANLPHYRYEGVGFHASDRDGAGLTEVYRFFKPGQGTHFYTASAVERDFVQNNLKDYSYEGVSFYVPDAAQYSLFG